MITRTQFLPVLCMSTLLTLGYASAAQDPAGAKILPIELGWAATKVNTGIFRHHAVLTDAGRQFVGYYDSEGHVIIASRDLPSETWTIHRTDFKGNVKDAHNGISLGVSSDGLLHLSYDHHGHPLRYRRSAAPGDPTSFGSIIPMTGQREQRVTYPQFVNLADGTLLFFYRDGGSGRGDVCINRYDIESGKWEVLQHPVISGGGEYNAYWCRPAVGNDGSLQLAWCWRRTGNAATNSRICYARSPDGGVNWENSRGERYSMPISPENAEIVDPVEENNNLSNQDSSEVDSHNRMHVVVRMNDGAEIPQYFHIWWDGGRWRKSQVSRFTEAYQLKGGGTLRTPLSRADLFIDAADRVNVLYRDNRLGSPPMVAQASPPDYDVWTHSSLADVNLRQWEPNYDIGRWKREGVLNLFIQSTDQGNHETATATGPQMVSILEWRPPPLPRVLLIGDSICLGYGEPTRKLLAGKADVHRLPTNGGPTIRGLEHLDEWLGTDHWDVIHFNWGLHDLRFMEDGKHQVPLDQYEKNLTELVRRLKRRGAKLIWASTTPVPDAKVSPPRKNSDVIAYNAAARRIAEQNGLAVDDLYAFALPRLAELQRAANVHFTEAGSAALAERVAASILEALGSPAGGTQAAPTAKRYFAHAARQDRYGVIAPWYTSLNGQCDLRVRVAAETLKRYPWTSGTDGKPLPDYIYNGRWSIASDGTITPGELKDWSNGDLVQRGTYAIFGLIAYYRYAGDPAAIAHACLIADAMLDRCRTGPDHEWPNFIISVPNAGEPYGPCSEQGMIQLDLAALAGIGLARVYQFTGVERYLEASRHWGALLAAKRNSTPGEPPWNRYANPQETYWNDRQTGGVVLIVRFLDELIRVEEARNGGSTETVMELIAARDAGREYVRGVLLPRWHVDETWGRDYWDWEHPVQSESLSEMVPRYLMQQPEEFANWRNDARNIMSLYLTRACVSPRSNGDVYHGAWSFPEGSQCCERSLSYPPMQIGAALAEYGARTGDEWALELARRQLILATYDFHETGVVEDNMDGGEVVAGGWFQIAHPLPLACVLDAMGWLPESLGANRENHIMRSTSVIRKVDYTPGDITYHAFDAPPGSVDVVRLTFPPDRISTQDGELRPTDPAAEVGYRTRPLSNGDCMVTIRRDGHRIIRIQGKDPARRATGNELQYDGAWKERQTPATERITSAAGATATFTFEGNQVRVVGSTGCDGGLADIYLDGEKQVCGIDYWNPAFGLTSGVVWQRSGLSAGRHELRIVAQGESNPLSAGKRVSIRAVDYSAATGNAGSGEGGGPLATQRWIFGYPGRKDYIDSRGRPWRPATETVIRLGHVADAVSAWYLQPRRLTVAGTDDPLLYAHGMHGKDFTAYATVAPGTYYVRLKFMESRWDLEPSARAMDVYINSRKVVERMDIAATAAGGLRVLRLVAPNSTKIYDGLNRAVDLVFNDIQPHHGIIAVRFVGRDGSEAVISAMEVGIGSAGQGATVISAPAH